MNYAYLRVSTDKQDVEKQKHGVKEFAKKKKLAIDAFVEDQVSGTKNWKDRQLGTLLQSCDNGDAIVFSEVSRIGRILLDILEFLKEAKVKGITVYIADLNFTIDDSMMSDITITLFGMISQIERKLISNRTKTALAKRKADGVILGRPKGSTSVNTKLASNHIMIEEFLEKGISIASLAKIHDVTWNTMSKYIDDHLPNKRNKTKHKRKGKLVETKPKKSTTRKRRKKTTS